MQEWTSEEEYQRIEQLPSERISELKERFNTSQFKQSFHLQPPFGSASKPNGLIYFNHQYLISHEWYPFSINNGLSYSYAYLMDNSIQVKQENILIQPDRQYDNLGIKGGSAYQDEDQVHFMFTGKSSDQSSKSQFAQMQAYLDADLNCVVTDKPMIEAAPVGYKEDQQDPKVFKKDDSKYAMLAGQTEKGQPRLLMYEQNQEKRFAFKGPMITNLTDFGALWHAPDYFVIHGYDFITFTQQIDDTTFKAGYMMGDLNFNQFKFKHGDFKLLDDGFGFMYPQTFQDKDGQRVLIGLLTTQNDNEQLSEIDRVPCFTVPRVLSMRNGKLYQQPHPSLQLLRSNEETALGYANKFAKQLYPFEGDVFELNIEILENDATEIYFEVKVSRTQTTQISYNTHSRIVTLDCGESGLTSKDFKDTKCAVQLNEDLTKLQIFADHSSIEVFCNEGERVMSSRIFPDPKATGIRVSTESGQSYLKFTKYDIQSIYNHENET